ncbi:MAG: fec operon regulator FecR [Mucilaginibacter sp.]|nr:fec operon regulator FecR [Mucilaginibacter sp.]
MQKEQFLEILKKYQDGNASAEEVEFLRTYYNLFELEPEILNSLKENEKAKIKYRMENRLMEQIAGLEPVGKKKSYRWIAVAASILLVLSFGGYFVLHKTAVNPQTAQNQPHDIAPGRNQATLTLANGQKIVLTKGLSGKLAQQGNTTIQVNAGNAITYTIATIANNPTVKVEYNTLTTIRGEQSPYPLVLVDGTKVWLDAASSITYPTAFNGNERLVTVTGEAYFEVAHNAAHPFKVKVKNQIIEDIGTAFNINAYDDEPALKTTLIEGSVKISRGSNMVTLKPGQQAAGNSLKVKDVDTEGVIAWKNNYFLFDGDNLESIMRKVSRWYDVDVVYQYDAAKTKMFGGTISRYKTVNSVLKKLEMTGAAHFHIKGKQIIVTK